VRGGLHHTLMPLIDDEGAILRTLVYVVEACERDIAVERLRRSQSRLLHLVAHRTGDAIRRRAIPARWGREWQVRKDLRLLSFRSRSEMRQRHVTCRALIFDRRLRAGVVDRLAPHAALPVRIAR